MAKHDEDEVKRKQDRAGKDKDTKAPIRAKSDRDDVAKRAEGNRKRTERDYG